MAAALDAVPGVLAVAVVAIFFNGSLIAGVQLWRDAEGGNPLQLRFGLVRPVSLVLGIAMAVVCVASSILVAWKGGTLGMLMAGLRVVPAGKPADGRVRFRRALLRTFAYLVGCLVPVLALVGLLLVMAAPRRQAVHDLVARTQVVAAL